MMAIYRRATFSEWHQRRYGCQFEAMLAFAELPPLDECLTMLGNRMAEYVQDMDKTEYMFSVKDPTKVE